MARRDNQAGDGNTTEMTAAIAREIDALAADVANHNARAHVARERQRELTALLAWVSSTDAAEAS